MVSLQLKFLKLILWLPLSTSNVFIFLEYGILPLGHEIQRRRLNFLYHILELDEADPVKLAYQQGLKLSHEPNWANDIKDMRTKYGISVTDEEVSQLSIGEWKKLVNDKVEEVVFHELVEVSQVSSKTKDLDYEQFACQKYLLTMDTFSVRRIARLRSRTFACKANQKSAWGTKLSCRTKGCSEVETQEHLMNCRNIQGDVGDIDSTFVKKGDLECDIPRLRELMKRVEMVEQCGARSSSDNILFYSSSDEFIFISTAFLCWALCFTEWSYGIWDYYEGFASLGGTITGSAVAPCGGMFRTSWVFSESWITPLSTAKP